MVNYHRSNGHVSKSLVYFLFTNVSSELETVALCLLKYELYLYMVSMLV